MTKIKFFKKKDNYVKLECSGHTGYGEYGTDVLCASISGIVQSMYIGLSQALGIDAKVVRHDSKGYISIELPSDINQDLLSQSQILFETVRLSIVDLMQGYSKYISMEVIENDY